MSGYFKLKDYDGVDGHGGKPRVYNNKSVYLGAGGHGACRVWIKHYYYYCMKCFTFFDTMCDRDGTRPISRV